MAKGQPFETDDIETDSGMVPSADSELAQQQTRSFAIKMLVAGAVACILPIFGLKLKGLPPEASVIVGVILLVIGGIALLSSFSPRFSAIATNGTKLALYGVIGIFGLILLAIAGFFLMPGIFGLLPNPQPAGQFNPGIAGAPAAPVNPEIEAMIAEQNLKRAQVLQQRETERLALIEKRKVDAAAFKAELERDLQARQEARKAKAMPADQAVQAAAPMVTPTPKPGTPKPDAIPTAVPNPTLPDNPQAKAKSKTREALEKATPADLDPLAAKFLASADPEEVKDVMNYLTVKKPVGPHDQISAALIKSFISNDTIKEAKFDLCNRIAVWGVPSGYATLLEAAKTAKKNEQFVFRTALQRFQNNNPDATEIPAESEILKQLLQAWAKPGELVEPGLLRALAESKSPVRTSGFAELLAHSSRIVIKDVQSTGIKDIQQSAAKAIQLWGTADSYAPLLEQAKAATGRFRDTVRVPLTALREGLPMAPEILPLDQELLQISLVWLNGKVFPGLVEHLNALYDAKPNQPNEELTKAIIPYLDEKLGAKANVAALKALSKWGTGTAIPAISKRYENEKVPEFKKAATVTLDILTKRQESEKKAESKTP